MSLYQVATPYPSAILPPVHPETGKIEAGRDYFLDEHGQHWSMRSATQFLLYYHWLRGEDIGPVVRWCQSINCNTVRVLGMVHWPDKGVSFGPGVSPNWWEQLEPFFDYLSDAAMRIEFTVFAAAQDIMPKASDQAEHLGRVLDTIGHRWNVFVEIANEPWQNGCDPVAIFDEGDARACPMAYGVYDIQKHQDPVNGIWYGTLPVLDYLTAHTPRDPDSWSRKAKDLAEYRDGSGDGTEDAPQYDGAHIPPVGDEPMGAAEAANLAGRQRSNIPQDFFWYHGNAAINGAGSTFHCDAGLDSVVPPPEGDQQKCAEAAALAWSSIAPEFQAGSYTRSGLADLPLVWEEHYFPEQTSRIYGRILGDRAVCLAIKPLAGWTPKASPGWVIADLIGPMNSLVLLVRDDGTKTSPTHHKKKKR